jgi:hypothetical protein
MLLRGREIPERRPVTHFFRAILFFALLIPSLPISAQEAASPQNALAGRLPRLSDGAEVS